MTKQTVSSTDSSKKGSSLWSFCEENKLALGLCMFATAGAALAFGFHYGYSIPAAFNFKDKTTDSCSCSLSSAKQLPFAADTKEEESESKTEAETEEDETETESAESKEEEEEEEEEEGADDLLPQTPSILKKKSSIDEIGHGESVPFEFTGFDTAQTMEELKDKNLIGLSQVFDKHSMPKGLNRSHQLTEHLSTLCVANKGVAAIEGGEVAAGIHCLRGCLQVQFFEGETEDDLNSLLVFVDAGLCCPVADGQRHSLECYTDDAQFEIGFFQ